MTETIVKIPCALGDHVYCLFDHRKVLEGRVDKISITKAWNSPLVTIEIFSYDRKTMTFGVGAYNTKWFHDKDKAYDALSKEKEVM